MDEVKRCFLLREKVMDKYGGNFLNQYKYISLIKEHEIYFYPWQKSLKAMVKFIANNSNDWTLRHVKYGVEKAILSHENPKSSEIFKEIVAFVNDFNAKNSERLIGVIDSSYNLCCLKFFDNCISFRYFDEEYVVNINDDLERSKEFLDTVMPKLLSLKFLVINDCMRA